MFKEYMIPTTKSSVKLIKNFSHRVSSPQKNEQIIISDKEKIIQSVTNLHKNSTIKVLNYLIPACYKMKKVWYGYKHMADQLGFCERTIQRAVHELQDLGLIQAEYRLMTSNIYKVNPTIYGLKEELKHKLPSLWGKFIILSLSLLVGNVLPNENKNYLTLASQSILVRSNSKLQQYHEEGLKFKKEERKKVSFNVDNLKISETLQEITDHLKLTKHGQCILLQYPNEALEAVWFKFYESFKQKEFKHCMQSLVNACEKYCAYKKMTVYRELYPLLLKRYNLDKNSLAIQVEEKKEEPKKSGVVIKSSLEGRIPEWQSKMQEDRKIPSWMEQFTQQFMENNAN